MYSIKTARVDVPELGPDIFVRRWSYALKTRAFAAIAGDTISEASRVEIVLCSASDATGRLLFTDADRAWLTDYDWTVIERIAAEALALNTVEKKSGTPSGASSSDSPAISG